MALYELVSEPHLDAAAMVGALEGWVDALGVATTAAAAIAEGGEVVARFDSDALFDYRAHRPILDIVDGKMKEVTWPELTVRRVRASSRDLLLLVGPEPDQQWRAFTEAVVDIGLRFAIVTWVSLGSIAAAVPHTRHTPLLTTASRTDLVETSDRLPQGLLRVPGAVTSLLEHAFAHRGILSVGFWAQVPHYVGGPYAAGVASQLERLGRYLGVSFALDELHAEADEQRRQLDAIVADRPQAVEYVHQLEAAYDAQAVPSGEEIAAEIERFLESTAEGEDPFGRD